MESNVATLIGGVCRAAGRDKGIEFHAPAAWGAPVPGRWEVSCRLKRRGWSATLTYCHTPDSLLSEEVFWSCGPFPGPDQKEKFKSEVSAKIDRMLEWVKGA